MRAQQPVGRSVREIGAVQRCPCCDDAAEPMDIDQGMGRAHRPSQQPQEGQDRRCPDACRDLASQVPRCHAVPLGTRRLKVLTLFREGAEQPAYKTDGRPSFHLPREERRPASDEMPRN